MSDLPTTLSIRGTLTTLPRGRSLHTTQPFSRGALIATLTPSILLPPRTHATQTCNHCLTPARRRCTACRAVAYCSAACQRADWRRVHGRECGVLRRVPTLPAPTRALVQALVAPAVRAALDGLRGGGGGGGRDVAGGLAEELRLQARAAVEYAEVKEEEAAVDLLYKVWLCFFCHLSFGGEDAFV